MTKKFQSGGVSQVIPRPQDGGDISVFQAPTFDLMPIPVREMLAIAHTMQVKKAQKEASDLAEQRYQDSLEAAYMDYSTKFFGDVHSATQKERLEGLQSKYKIPEQGSAAILSNKVLLKDTLRNFRLALSDKDFIDVVGEVDRGNKFRDYAQKNFDKETFVEWEQSAWEPYVKGEADLEAANPTRFKPVKSAKAKDFTIVDNRFIPYLNYLDLGNEEETEKMFQSMATAYRDADEEAAIRQGLIDPTTGQLSQEKKDELKFFVGLRQREIGEKREATMEDYAQRKAIADMYADGNRQPRSSNSNDPKTPEDLETTFRKIEALEQISLPRDNPRIAILVEMYAGENTGAERERILGEIILEAEKKKGSTSSVTGTEADLLGKASAPITPKGVLAPPKPSLKELMKQNGL